MIMLAIQPISPPTTSQMMKFMFLPRFKPLKSACPLRSGAGGPALTLLNDCDSAGAGNVRSLFVRRGAAHEALPLSGVSGFLQGYLFPAGTGATLRLRGRARPDRPPAARR